MNEEELAEQNYRSGLPGVLGMIDTFISRLEAVILATGVILMAVNTVANVIGRFVFGQSIFFSGEINRILIIMITFAGLVMRPVTAGISACPPFMTLFRSPGAKR